jgi:hypothetical protein
MTSSSFLNLPSVLLISGFLTVGAAMPALAALNDTGITTCSNNTQNGLPCPVTDFPGQDAQYGANRHSFTKLDATTGSSLSDTATDHGCVRDNVTGLVWEVKTDDGRLRDQDHRYTWYDGTNGTPGNAANCGGTLLDALGALLPCNTTNYVAAVNTVELCGANNWRMPTRKELERIMDLSRYSPAIDPNYFPNTPGTYFGTGYFWSGSLYASDMNQAWKVDFANGNVYPASSGSAYAIRLVRN